MGLLERWDRRNQETAEYHNETAPDIDEMASHVIGQKFWIWYLATWVFSALLGVGLRWTGISQDRAESARIVILVGISVTLLIAAVVQARYRRAEWKRNRSTA